MALGVLKKEHQDNAATPNTRSTAYSQSAFQDDWRKRNNAKTRVITRRKSY